MLLYLIPLLFILQMLVVLETARGAVQCAMKLLYANSSKAMAEVLDITLPKESIRALLSVTCLKGIFTST